MRACCFTDASLQFTHTHVRAHTHKKPEDKAVLHTHTLTQRQYGTINHKQPSSAPHPTLLSYAPGPRLTLQSLYLPQYGAEVACHGD